MPLEFDLITDYFPEAVDNAKVRDAYSRIQAWYAYRFPDLDTRPGSVFGDSFVLPAATYLASTEDGMSAFAADLDLEGVANGEIGRCDFVALYLKGFGAFDNKELVSTGILRVVFSQDQGFEMNKNILFSYNDNNYQLKLFGEPVVRILPVGSRRETGNDYVLTQTSGTRFFVDMPVESRDQGAVVSASRFTSSIALPNNTEIQAVGDFFISSYTSSLPSLAKKTRETFHAASMGTKSGVSRTLKREFPDLLSVSPTIQGQPEMTRACTNQFGVTLPAADIFIKSPYYGSSITQVVQLTYVDGRFFSPVEFTHVPLSITRVTLAGATEDLVYTLFTKSSNENLYPRLSSAFSSNAGYWVDIDMPSPPLPVATDDQGVTYQNFEITYTTEPYVDIVSRWLEDPVNTPIGSNFQVRACVPIALDSMEIRFRRDRGKKFDRTQATTEIYEYLTRLSWPDSYTDAAIYDSMYYNGASTTKSVESSGYILYSPATMYVTDEGNGTHTDILANSQEIPKTYAPTSEQYTALQVDSSEPQDNLFYAASDVNLAFLISQDNINLIES